MEHLAYFAILVLVVVACGWLEFVVRTRVLQRARRFALSVAPVLAVFLAWDAYAVAAGHWSFDPERTTGVRVGADIPIEELAFFVIVPFAAVLTFEAVRAVCGWTVGDESPGEGR